MVRKTLIRNCIDFILCETWNTFYAFHNYSSIWLIFVVFKISLFNTSYLCAFIDRHNLLSTIVLYSMDKLLIFLSDVGDARVGGADSYSDRLSCRYTVFILSFFTLIVTARQYFKAPISCWCPKEFSTSHVAYVDRVRMMLHRCKFYVSSSIKLIYLNQHFVVKTTFELSTSVATREYEGRLSYSVLFC